MRHDFIDRYSRIDSFIHRLPSGLKLFVAIAIVLLIIAMPRFTSEVLSILALVLFFVALLSRIPMSFIFKRLLIFESLIFGIAVLTLLRPNGGIVFITIVLKSTLCLLTMILLSNTTPFSELLLVLKRIRFPALLISILALMYRYLFLIIDEAERMTRARTSRTFSKKRFSTWRSLAETVGQLFIRTTERAERIYSSMCARGWK